MRLTDIVHITRMDKPIGTFLLWYPTAWALWMANQGQPDRVTLLLFILGTFLMRSAGCVINDYFDKDFDRKVTRTQNRPLAKKSMKPIEALGLLLILLSLALGILFYLPENCFYYALCAVVLTGIYPLCKRFIQAPQLILSLAFSFGIPMAYAASNQPLTESGWFLIVINILWVLAYDTIYAMADKKDDLVAGIKSTAVYFGVYDKLLVGCLQFLLHLLWLAFASYTAMNPLFYAGWLTGLISLVWQNRLLQQQAWIEAFKMNNLYGFSMWIAIIVGVSP